MEAFIVVFVIGIVVFVLGVVVAIIADETPGQLFGLLFIVVALVMLPVGGFGWLGAWRHDLAVAERIDFESKTAADLRKQDNTRIEFHSLEGVRVAVFLDRDQRSCGLWTKRPHVSACNKRPAEPVYNRDLKKQLTKLINAQQGPQ